MVRNIKHILLLSLLVLNVFFIKAQSGLCDANVPFYNVDLTSAPNATWISPSFVRNENCCGTTHPNKCAEFSVMLHPNAMGINFEIASGAVPPGALFYQINCGPQIPVGQPICLYGVGPHIVTFCKPGNNQNTYQVTSIPMPEVSPPQIAKENCPAQIWVTGLVASTITWQDVSGGGMYNSYLSCTNCTSPTVTPSTGFPPYVDFEVCGTPVSLLCQGMYNFCDTVRVYFYDTVQPYILPNPPMYCTGATGVLINGAHYGGIPPFTYIWYDQANGNGNVISNNTDIFASTPGSYSLVVLDSTYPFCPPSVLNFDVSLHPNYEFTEVYDICDNASFYWHGQFYSTSGIYYDSLTTMYGCDSVYILNLNLNPNYEFVIYEEICQGDIFYWQGQNYGASGTYYDSLNTVYGCDSVYILHLLVHPVYEFIVNAEICDGDSYFWQGQIYSSSGTYYDSLNTVYGCDSVYILHLLVHPVYEFIINAEICDGQSYLWQGQYYNTTDVYYDSLLSINGCDSVFILNLTVYPTYEFQETAEICQGDVYNWHGLTLNSAGFYYDSLLTINGCDSIYILELTINPVYEFTTNAEICSGDSLFWQGYFYNTHGTFYDSLTTTYGCDSIFILNLVINPVYEFVSYIDICDGQPYFWQGQYYSSSGTYHINFQTQNGCDSIFILHLTVNPIYEIISHVEICSGQSFYWEGNSYNTSGTYFNHLQTFHGCDSILILQLIVHPAYFFSENAQICQGGVFSWQGNLYNQSGIYVNSLQTVNGCDSIYELHLTVNPAYFNSQVAEICQGDSILFQNNYYSLPGVYQVNYTTQHNCDSIFELHLMILNLPIVSITGSTQICYGDTAYLSAQGGLFYYWNTGAASANITVIPAIGTTYTVTVTNITGCSQTGSIYVDVYPQVIANAGNNQISCSGQPVNFTASGGVSYLWSTGAQTPNINVLPLVSSTYTVTVTDIYGCTASDDVFAIVNPLPNIQAGPDTSICIGHSVNLYAGGGLNYTWSPSLGLNDTAIHNPIATPTITTTYTVSVLDNNGCSNTDALVITVHALPAAFAGNDTTICPGTSFQLNASGGTYYTWSPHTYLSDSSIGNPIVTPLNPITYTLTVSDIYGCTNTSQVAIDLFDLPNIFIYPPFFKGCAPVTVHFSDSTIGNVTHWEWNFGDPSSIYNISNAPNPSFTYYYPGIYSITLSVISSDGCFNSAVFNNAVEVYPDPVASFYTTTSNVDEFSSIVHFFDTSIDAVAWHWNFGDFNSASNTSNIPNPNHTYTAAGTYKVVLAVSSIHGCIDSTYKFVTVQPRFTFYIPNAFTPNGDGYNDYFQGYGTNIKDYHMMIFTRWGELIFESKDYDIPWNGKYWNKKHIDMEEVFVYKFIIHDFRDLRYVYYGHVTLIRPDYYLD